MLTVRDDSIQNVSEDDLASARDDVRRGIQGLVVGLLAVMGFTGLLAGLVAALLLGHGQLWETALLCAAACVVLGWPLVVGISAVAQRRGLAIGVEKVVQGRVMEREARRREFETSLGRALEMAGDEIAAYDTIKRAISGAVPDSSVELLLADNSHAHLDRVVAVVADEERSAGCPVSSPDQCVAARRAQTQVFPDSEALDACPRLRERGESRCSAVCVPVSIMGRTVGVVHATAPLDEPLDDDGIESLQVLANESGNRLGMLRIMAETQLQASTDGLTGLMNRRSLENRARVMRASGTDFALVLADLDHFKSLNDTHGHETGDRALRVFAETLRSEVRTEDLACRYGGEEFVVLLPRAEMHEAIEAMERVRDALARATRRGDVPTFTASFGIAHSNESVDFDDVVHRADKALFMAKDAGRDCICIDGHTMAVAPNLTAIN